jgi:anti-anti-sigma regulatory factor
MPKYQHRIDLHRLFLVEERGDTIIISPKGDPAGFANLNFSTEHAALVGLLGKNPPRNVLVDLGGSNYFGAKILGAMSDWESQTEAQGKQFAVCALSDDMRELLRIFDFEDRWKQFPTRESAIKAIVKESPAQAMRSHWRAICVFCLMMLMVGLSFVPWEQYYARYVNEKDYQTVMQIWADMESLKATNAPPAEWRKLQSRAKRELEPMVERLESRAGATTGHGRVAQCLLFATRDNILKRLLVQKDRMDLYRPTSPEKEIFWVHTSIYLEKARRVMNGQDTSDLNFPQATEYIALESVQEPGEVLDDGPQEIIGDSPPSEAVNESDQSPQPVRPAVAESYRSRVPDAPGGP